MSRRRIGQETFGFGDSRGRRQTSLDELTKLIDWTRIEAQTRRYFVISEGKACLNHHFLFKALLFVGLV